MNHYSDLLKDPRWQKRRLEVLERDGWKCRSCMRKDITLHVHHLAYSRNPWEAPDNHLETLCENCHAWRTRFDDFFDRTTLMTGFVRRMVGIMYRAKNDNCEFVNSYQGNIWELLNDLRSKWAEADKQFRESKITPTPPPPHHANP